VILYQKVTSKKLILNKLVTCRNITKVKEIKKAI